MLIAIPSKGRAGRVTSDRFLAPLDPVIFCPAGEVEAYAAHHARVAGVPETFVGLTPTRNFILDYAASRGERSIVQADDDCIGVVKFEAGKRGRGRAISAAEFAFLVENMAIMAAEAGARLWGFQVTDDGQTYREYSPFSLQAFIPGNFMGILDDGQRFDERFVVKEDYDFTLESLRRYRRVWRCNKYAWYVEHQATPGGCRSYRTFDLERRMIALLRAKWGSLVRGNPKKPYECRIRSPIPGI